MKFRGRTCILFFLFCLYISNAYAQIITTVAGSAVAGFSGDGGPATMAELLVPSGVAADKNNNLYIADNDNNRVRKVDAITGIITTVAGNGLYGFSGDGGPAISASLKAPTGIAIDAGGNIYIADYYNQRIRKVDALTGIITTIAGNGTFGFGGDGGPAVSANIWLPTGVAVDASNNVYIADNANQRIRKIDGSTGIITTIAGNGIAGFSGDGGLATAAWLSQPYGISLDADRNLFIADYANNRIRRVDAGTGIISTVAGTGLQGFNDDDLSGLSTNLTAPTGVTVDIFGNLYIADLSQRVLRLDAVSSIITTIAGNGTQGFSGDGGPALNAQLFNSWGVFITGNGDLYIADNSNNRVRKVALCFAPLISSTPSNTRFCSGGDANFEVKATGATSYQWQINTNPGWQNLMDSPDYTGTNTDSLNLINIGFGLNGSEYRCEVSNGCGSQQSGPDTLTVVLSVTPSLEINSTSTSVCKDSAIEFTAIPTNGGATPSFQWKVNGIDSQMGLTSYTNNHLTNGDIVSCLMTSNAVCAIPLTAISNSIQVSVTSQCNCILDEQTKIYPTFFQDIFFIDKAITGCEVRMDLYNILGQVLIRNMQIQNGLNEINLSALAAGMYVCVFYSGDKVLRKEKIMKASWKY